MASKKKIASTIMVKCPKCGKVEVYTLLNRKELKEGSKKIYRCNRCGTKVER